MPTNNSPHGVSPSRTNAKGAVDDILLVELDLVVYWIEGHAFPEFGSLSNVGADISFRGVECSGSERNKSNDWVEHCTVAKE